jgi:predicted metal-dependent hydrolase
MAGLLRKFVSAWAEVPPEPQFIFVDNRQVSVSFRSNIRAKRMVLRLSRDSTGVTVTLPKRVSRTQALAFVEKSIPWISRQLERHTPSAVLGHGSIIPLRGIPHEVQSTSTRRGLITIDPVANIISVPGDAAHLGRRLQDWLKKLAKAELMEASTRYAKVMDVDFKRISIRDQKSRWGSCSASGDLSYSWRLILAPSHILDYVAAHEVAHRQHMNHGPKFWRLVLTHCPHAQQAKQWFKLHSAELHRFKS